MTQRIIKFRAWDWDAKKIIDNVPVFEGVAFENATTEDEIDNCQRLISEVENYPLMQFTGLLDKNGKEIYEGDIVSSEGWNNQVVEWKEGMQPYFQYYQDSEDMEIIGNIYENPELLK